MPAARTYRDGGPVAAGRMRALEDELGLELPREYRAFLADHDGVGFEPSRMDPKRNPSGSDAEVRSLYGVDELLRARGLSGTRMPAELLAIGDAEGGNRIALGVSGSARGRVFYWDHEGEADEGEPPTWDNLTELAPTFSAWHDALVALDDDDLPAVEGTGSINPGFLERMRREGRL